MPIAALPTDALSLVLAQLSVVRNIKGVKRTCRAFRDAAPIAEQAHRRVCFEHSEIMCVAASSCRRSASAAAPKPRDASLRRGVAGDLDAPGVASQAMWPGLWGGIRGFCAQRDAG